MAPHSSTLAWKIPWTEEPGRLQSMGSWRVRHDWATSLSLFTFMHWRRKWQPTPVFFPGESQGRGSLVGCHLWGRTESDTTEVTWQQQQYLLHFANEKWENWEHRLSFPQNTLCPTLDTVLSHSGSQWRKKSQLQFIFCLFHKSFYSLTELWLSPIFVTLTGLWAMG